MVYQKNVVDGGEIDCVDRWNLIRPELPDHGVLFDVGSAEGFFCKSALEQTNLFVISLEKSKECIEIQKSWAKKYKNRLIISQCSLSKKNVKELILLNVDVVLLLSTLHWFKDPDFMLKNLFMISKKIIVEIPEPSKRSPHGRKIREITGGNIKKYLKKITGKPVKCLGKTKGRLSDYRRLWLIENDRNNISDISSFICEKLNVVYGEFKND
jgi:hypothetical protein